MKNLIPNSQVKEETPRSKLGEKPFKQNANTREKNRIVIRLSNNKLFNLEKIIGQKNHGEWRIRYSTQNFLNRNRNKERKTLSTTNSRKGNPNYQ